jgi:serine phosphatase RsbU (regulator of sigma subunit)
MGQLRGLLRGIALSGDDGPLGVVTKLDEVIAAQGVDVTATVVVAHLGEGRLRWTNAGHPGPVLVPHRGPVRLLGPPTSDLLLGIDPATPRRQEEVTPGPGDTLVLYTDGLVERRDQSLDAGTELLRAALAELRDLPLGELCDALLARLLPARPEDDVAVLAVRLTG